MTSATERLRALLDERGVEWTADDGECVKETCWPYMGELTASFAEYANGTTRFACDTWCFTPEQVIAATLGETPTPPPPTPPKQPPYDELIESLRRDWDIEASWDGLRRFWYVGLTDEGVRKRDEREATLGRGTCRLRPWKMERDTGYFDCMECECGHVADVSDWDKWHYCPNCGRKVVDPTTNDVDAEVAMSMISSLIDELRKSADEWNGSNMFELARMCSDAADTIWQLRDDLQRANAENAKLRKLGGFMLRCISQYHDCADCLVNGEHCEISYIESDARELGVEVR